MYVIVKECTLLEAQLEYCNHNLKVQYECCQWIDALNNVVQVRHAAIPPLMSYVSGLTTAEYHGSDSLRRDVENFVGLLVDIHTTLNSDEQKQRLDTRHSAIDKKFVCKHGLSLLPVIWYKPIKPIYTNRFLIHLVLSMGSYDNELSLFESGSIRNAFILAGLLRNEDVEGSAKRILNKYVTQQLVNMAGGAASFDRMVCAADSAVTCCFRDETMYADGTPPVLYTKLVQAVTAQQLDMLLLWNNNFLHAIVGNINDLRLQSVPSYQSLSEYTTARLMASVSETALDSNIPVVMPWSALGQPRPVTQSLESYSEQQLALNVAEDAVRRYMSASEEVPKCTCIVGDPGSGKTTVAMMVMLFCVTRGLHCGATALMSERAMELGGVHFHKLSNCPTQNNLSVLQMAERAIGTMLKTNNSYYHILKKIDVLLIDELGQMSSEAISVLDTILRRIRNSVRFMGGILLITTMDIMQLLPIQGRPPMLSCHMLTSFTFCRLQNSVRSGQDPDFCKLQKMTRLMAHEWNSSTENEFRDLFKRTCTFVNSFDDDSIPRMATYVFGRKHPGQLIHDKVVKRRCQHEEYIVAHARDEEMVLQGNWIPNESDVTSRRLSATLKEPHDLYLFARAVYKITYNDSHRAFSQSQLAILMTLPTRELIKNLKPIVMYACPPGRKEIPPHDCTVSQLLSWGWTRIMIRIAPPQVVNVYSRLRARRHQYGIRLHISTTAHGCMGHTLHSLVTKVSAKEATYKLWSKPQVVVMLSRTNLGKNTIFVGDPDETCDALINTMKKTNQYYEYMQILMTNLIHQTNISSSMMPVIDQRLLPMRASDILLPDDNTGVVYILVSLQNRDVTYIGQTNNLSRRIDQHNTRSGSIQTSSAVLQPWALVAYVSGFGNNKMKRLEFEKQWQAKVHRLGSTLSTNEIVDLGNSIIVDRKEICPDEDLRFIRIESTLDY
jgi:predicted GIY-YIG superfamily endonuclease